MTPSTFFAPSLTSACANPDAVFTFPTTRISLLTPRMFRIETSPNGEFEDRPSQVFWYRSQPLPKAVIRFDQKQLSIATDFFMLDYLDSDQGTIRDSMQITIKSNGTIFHLDDLNSSVLPGTTRTLDESNGPVRLQSGLLSRTGWIQLDDTTSLVFNREGWLEQRPARNGYRDLYLLISGSDYKSALNDYQKITGFPPLLPRAFLGNWWSRYWEYSQQEIQQLIQRFEQEKIPLSVFIIDMDWHITKTGNQCSGWTGFSWNQSLFPDPSGLLQWMHSHNLLSALNLHPAEGIHPHESSYPQVAKALGIDPGKKKAIPFNISNPEFARVYFNEVLHPLEDQGVDFWWLDWQQGDRCSIRNLDPLWLLNHLHFYDLGRNPNRRPVVFSRWGGFGNHRYPIGFSGDTKISWKSLAYQPFFTASAANCAYGWWSHDIGGHMFGMEDPELYTRWVQFGVLSPIFRLHCTKNPFVDRAPWAFNEETLRIARKSMQFRHSLIPYLYTMSRRNQLEGIPIVTPLYYDWPDEENAWCENSQYLFGNQLMAAPITSALDPDLNLSRKVVWFPPGTWFDFADGEKFEGSRWKINYYRLDETPLFARAGAIVPLQSDNTHNGSSNPDSIDLFVFPGQNGNFSLYEDDGVTQDYVTKGGCITEYRSTWKNDALAIKILPALGDIHLIPQQRAYQIHFRGVNKPDAIFAALNGKKLEVGFTYDTATRTVTISPVVISPSQSCEVEIVSTKHLLAAPRSKEQKVFRILKHAKIRNNTKWAINAMIPDLIKDINSLSSQKTKLKASQLTALIETLCDVGAAEIKNLQGDSKLILLNPEQLPGFTYQNRKSKQTAAQEKELLKSTVPIIVDYFGLVQKKF